MVSKIIDCPSEAVEQAALIRWADHHWFGKHLFAIPNGGLRNKIVAAKLKREGVRRGIPDLFLTIPKYYDEHKDSIAAHGLFLEMKRKKGSSTSKYQTKCINLLRGKGYEVEVCKGWVEAANVICEYLGERCDV